MKETTKLDQIHKLPPPALIARQSKNPRKGRTPKGRIVECPHCHHRFPIR